MSYTVYIAYPRLDGDKIVGGKRSYYCGCDERRPGYPRHFDGKFAGCYCDACWAKKLDEWLGSSFHL